MIVDSKSYYMDTREEANDFYLRHVFDAGPMAKLWPPQYVMTVPKRGAVEAKWVVVLTEFADNSHEL